METPESHPLPTEALPTGSPSTDAKQGALGKLLGVFFQPQATFRAIGQDPGWVVPLVACLILAFVSTAVIVNRMGVGNILRSAMQGNPKAEEIATVAEGSAATKFMMYAAPVVQTPLLILVIAGVFLLVLTLLSSVELSFKKTFSVVAHSLFAYSLVATGLTMVTVFATKDFVNFDLKNPVASNVGFFLDPAETSKFVHSLASSLDVLSFWFIFLLATGFSQAAPKGKRPSTLPVVLGVWAVYVIGKSVFASLSS